MEATADTALQPPGRQSAMPAVRAPVLAGVLLSLLAALPFLFAVRPQQADYPSHLARYHVMADGGRSAWLSRYYEFDWALSGNQGVDLLMVPLGRLMGIENAAFAIAVLLPVLVGLGIVAVALTLRGRIGVGALLAMATIWSPAMVMGFANFSLSLAMALFGFAAWVRMEPLRWRWALFLVAGIAVWLCHSMGWGLLGVLVFGYEWHRRRSWTALLVPWPLFTPFAFLAAGPGMGDTLHYGNGVAAYKLGIWVKALADTDVTLDVLSVLALAGAVLLAARMRAIDGRLGWAALIVALLTIAMPRHFGGGDLADQRLVPVALMLGCLAIDARVPRWMLWLAPALFLVRLGAIGLDWQEQSARLEAAMPALDLVPEGARVAFAVPHDSRRWGSAPLEHAGSYATVYRDALVNTHFALPGVHMLQLRGMDAGFADPSQRIAASPGEAIDLSEFAPASRADFLWYVGDNPVRALPPGAQVIQRSPGSLLARLANPSHGR